jgi:hypothetical protein
MLTISANVLQITGPHIFPPLAAASASPCARRKSNRQRHIAFACGVNRASTSLISWKAFAVIATSARPVVQVVSSNAIAAMTLCGVYFVKRCMELCWGIEKGNGVELNRPKGPFSVVWRHQCGDRVHGRQTTGKFSQAFGQVSTPNIHA